MTSKTYKKSFAAMVVGTFLLGFTMVENTQAMANESSGVIENAGPVKKLLPPADWTLSQSKNSMGVARTSTATNIEPADHSATISLRQRHRTEAEKGAKYLHDLIAESEASKKEKILQADEIKKLNEILDTAGTNQYTIEPEMAPAPFQMAYAKVKPINGKTVLEIAGYYVDNDSKPVEYYRIVMIPTNAECRDIYELFLTAKTKGQFEGHVKDFEKVLKSIEWM